MKYYKIQYHKKDEHTGNWYDCLGLNQYDTKTEAYEVLILYMQQKLVVFLHPEVDQFRIMFVNEEEVYTTWRFNAESGR
jgi:hypothetical protein